MRTFHFVLLAFIVLFLQGCSTQFLKEFAREIKGFEERNTVKETPKPAPAVYCYNTLGSVSCYEKPQPNDSDSRYVGTSVEPIDPAIQENQIEGNTALPPVKVEEEPLAEPQPVFTDEQKEDPKPVAEPMPASDTMPKAAAPAAAESSATDPSTTDAPPNRPLYDPYLNQLEEKPVDNTVIKPPVPTQEPIVPPKKKSKKKTTEKK